MQVLFAITLALALVSSERTFLDSEPQAGNTIVFVSDSSTWVVGAQSTTGAPSTVSLHAYTASIPGANWIWDVDQTVISTSTFWKTFTLVREPTKANLQIAADDGCKIWINGVNIGQDAAEGTFNSNTQRSLDVTKFLGIGENILKVEVFNGGFPAGLLYKLTIN